MIETMESSDAHLVAETLAGSRDAFGQIVTRYQTLICSLAYSRIGSLSQSEDVAQETFLTAWKQLKTLREPEKLRMWLCGIARHRIYDSLKREGREPAHKAESLEEVVETPSPDVLPLDKTISNEEAAILWRSLEQVPENYRDPLVLFYREHQSVEAVARNLDLTEDVVRQRLSRGRKLLQEQVLAFVEGALARTSPGKVFTVGVLAALPALTISAQAATLGAVAVKGSAAAKTAAATGLLGAICGPLFGFLGMWLGYRMSMDASRTEKERAFNRAFYRRLSFCILGFFVVFGGLMFLGGPLFKTNPPLFAALAIVVTGTYLLIIGGLSRWAYRARKQFAEEFKLADKPDRMVWEYRSRKELLGLPLLHIRLGDRQSKPVKAWIATGDYAWGILFAFGGVAVAPVSVGGLALGVISFGGVGVGVLALGGLALGGWSFGGLAVGWQAFGGCAIAWNAAWGGYAIAHDYALGGVAHALNDNKAEVKEWMERSLFFRVSAKVLPAMFFLNVIWIGPMILQWQVIRRIRRKRRAQESDSTA